FSGNEIKIPSASPVTTRKLAKRVYREWAFRRFQLDQRRDKVPLPCRCERNHGKAVPKGNDRLDTLMQGRAGNDNIHLGQLKDSLRQPRQAEGTKVDGIEGYA